MSNRLAPPRDLTIPEPGSTTARDVLSRSLGRLLPDLRALPRALPPTEEGRAELAAFAAAVERCLAVPSSARGPGGGAAVMSCLRSPTVAALLRSVRNETKKASFDRAYADGVLVELLATLAFELALAGVVDELHLTRLPRRIVSLAAGASIVIPEGATAGVFTKERVVFERGDERIAVDPVAIAQGDDAVGVTVTRPYHAIAGGTLFAVDDNNPRAAFGAEPGEQGNPVDLGDRPPSAWTDMLKECLALIEEHCPTLRGEIELFIRQIVPAGYHAETHRSASYRESVGAIYMTLHPNVMTMTEALIHEFSHNKLHALFEVDPVIENPSGARYRSPVRADLRPLRGVLLAVHAFLPVAHLYERMTEAKHVLSRQHYFPQRFAQIRAMNRDGAAVVLEHARPTEIGRGLLDEIRRWIGHFAD